jgi:hypothetical protein|tara:strand:+ start:1388 stop:1612 length:225 start_codon:yes stop_codon:yes gene_type:complete
MSKRIQVGDLVIDRVFQDSGIGIVTHASVIDYGRGKRIVKCKVFWLGSSTNPQGLIHSERDLIKIEKKEDKEQS